VGRLLRKRPTATTLSLNRIMDLHRETNKFKEWAKSYPGVKSGEWECDYGKWDEYYETCIYLINNKAQKSLTDIEKSDLIYAIARDNEQEYLIDIVAKNETLLFSLCEASIGFSENDAKWQFASRLGEVRNDVRYAEKLLLKFVNDTNEYVSRRALLALSELGSSQTEKFCIRAWGTNHEYQRIAALSSLKTIESKMLPEYLNKAYKDGRKYIVAKARKIDTEIG
jgi:hypothetical protein